MRSYAFKVTALLIGSRFELIKNEDILIACCAQKNIKLQLSNAVRTTINGFGSYVICREHASRVIRYSSMQLLCIRYLFPSEFEEPNVHFDAYINAH